MLDALRHGQAHIPLVALGVALGAGVVLGFTPSAPALVLVGAGAWAVYVGERLVGASPEDAANHPARTRWIRAHRAALGAGLMLAAGVGVWALAGVSPGARATAAALAALGGAYAARGPRGGRLKAHPLAKLAAIGLGWSAGGVLLPALDAAGRGALPGELGWPLAGVLVARACVVAANVVLLDVPDRAGDRAAGLVTIATRAGARGAARAAAGLLGAALVLGAAVLVATPGPAARWGLVAGPLLMLAFAVRPPRGRPWEPLALDALVGWGGFVWVALRLG